MLTAPRQVFDDNDDVDMTGTLVSEIGASERFFRHRSRRAPEAVDKWSRLKVLRQRTDITIVDLSEREELTYTELRSPELALSRGLVQAFGPGEAAVMAIAQHRGTRAVIDEYAGRALLQERSPGQVVLTTRDVLRLATPDLISSPEAEIIYADILAEGYRGPSSLW